MFMPPQPLVPVIVRLMACCLIWKLGGSFDSRADTATRSTSDLPTFQAWKSACLQLQPNAALHGRWPKLETLPLAQFSEFEKVLRSVFELTLSGPLTESNRWVGSSPSSDFYNLRKAHFARVPSPFEPFVQRLTVPSGTEVWLHGDLHGDVISLIKRLSWLEERGDLDNFKLTRTNQYMVFLGDYTDRGVYGIEVLYTLLRLRLANPDRVVLVRGNHEDLNLVARYGFLAEGQAKYGDSFNAGMICRFYDFLPAALYLGTGSDYVQCSHGGMEPGFNPGPLLDAPPQALYRMIGPLQQRTFLREHPEFRRILGETLVEQRSTNFADTVLLSPTQPICLGLMWNDFTVAPGEPDLGFVDGRSTVYGEKAVRYLLEEQSTPTHKLRAVLRAHQHAALRNPIMDRILASRGWFRHWQTNDSTGLLDAGIPKLETTLDTRTEQPLPAGSVWTINVSPDTPYGLSYPFSLDVMGMIRTAEKMEGWRARRITLVPAGAGKVKEEQLSPSP